MATVGEGRSSDGSGSTVPDPVTPAVAAPASGPPQRHHHSRTSFVLGIDIGTTTVKVCLLDANTKRLASSHPPASLSRETKATLSSELGPAGNEQDVHKICTALQFCVSRLPKEQLQRVNRVAVSGQMHGLVLWKHGAGWRRNQFGRYETSSDCILSRLYTWQDGRCSPDFLATLPRPDSHLRLSSGHGAATLFWLRRNRPDELAAYDRAGTIQDYVVAMLCDLERPVMSTQNAASWGYFDTVRSSWNIDKLIEADFPLELLPDVLPAGSTAGTLHSSWYGIEEGAVVGAALGDLQCSVFSTLETDTDAVFNISTSAQLSFIMPEGFIPAGSDPLSATEYFPYFDGRYLAVAASLNGGNVMAVYVRMLQQWSHDLGLGIPEDKIWERILTMAQDDSTAESDLVIVPLMFGERHLPEERASISNIDPLNISLGKVSRALCRGVVKNIHNMMSRDRLITAGVERIVGSGSALTRNAVLRKEVESQYDLPVVYGGGSDAALGVALAFLAHSKQST